MMNQKMAKYDLKTKPNNSDVEKFIESVEDPQKQEDSKKLVSIFEEITGYQAKMWGSAIIGFGSYHYKYASGHEGDMPITGFSPRVQSLTIYISTGFEEYAEASGYDPTPLLKKLGKHKISKACLYFKRLSEIDELVLRQLIKTTVKMMGERKKREGQ